jgi:hypothetical protein
MRVQFWLQVVRTLLAVITVLQRTVQDVRTILARRAPETLAEFDAHVQSAQRVWATIAKETEPS